MNNLSVSDFNVCSLQSYPENSKKLYSGLMGHWRQIKYKINTIHDWEEKVFEFAFKQKSKKYSLTNWIFSKNKQVLHSINYEKEFNFWDYNSCFIVFNIYVFTHKGETRIMFSLNSTDDGDFHFDILNSEIENIKKFVKQNYKTLNFESLENYLLSVGSIKN